MIYFIIGYMASGKTTFGKALARDLKMNFIDLDFYIEQRFHKSVSQIFADSGEEGFREIERAMLREAGEFEDTIVSCGGGTPCFFDNMEYMNQRGTTVWLDVSADRTVQRLVANNSRRPLMAGKSPDEIRRTVEEGLAKRLPYYSQAQIRFSGEYLETRDQIASAIAHFKEGVPFCNNQGGKTAVF